MEIKEIQSVKKEIVIDVFCDCCGASCKVETGVVNNAMRVDNGEEFHHFDYMELKGVFGYYSAKDNQVWTAQVCEKCVDEKLSFIKFKKS